MLLQDLAGSPPARAVILCYVKNFVTIGLYTDLVHAVFVAVKRQKATVAEQASGFDGSKHGVRIQGVIGSFRVVQCTCRDYPIAGMIAE